METTGNVPRNGARPAARPSVNDDIRRLSSNLALVINHCGLSQSELSRRSGLSRQLINSWARKRGSVSLSATVGQLLNVMFDPEREFNRFIPADACTVLTTF